MALDAWYKTVTPRKEVREGRSFNPDEFAIHLEQVVAKTAPEDYRDPQKFFSRTCFTRALREHAGMVLRRLAGETANTSPVLTLVTQFGGGKTHTLTALYHIARAGKKASGFPGVGDLVAAAGVPAAPTAKVAVFVGNAWDPQEGRETPWIDIARQLAGDEGVAVLGAAAKSTPPGTEALTRLFATAGGTVLVLLDEVLNFLNRHRAMAEPFHAFIQNLTVATTGVPRASAVISLPRSQVEMTPWDAEWQDKITKVVRRVAKDLIANDETEIAEVVRRRLFDDYGDVKVRRRVAKAFADWCYERRAQLPPEWTAVDTATTEAKARDFLQSRFEASYPFHPATLSVFQRKWQSLPHYQQTRGTLAMLAQWIAWAQKESFAKARREPLITLGSAPLEISDFRGVVLGQLAEPRLVAGIDADIAGAQAHARALDADTSGPLKDIHRRVGTAILFESSGGQADKAAHLPELRFALGEPDIETTSIDNAAHALEAKAYYIRRVGADGYRIWHQPTLKKVVSDRRASLDEESEIRPAVEQLVRTEFERGRSGAALAFFPADGADVPDAARLTFIVMDPRAEWGSAPLRARLAEWTRKRGASDRLYPGALVWCARKPGRQLKDKVESWLAWRRVKQEIDQGTLAGDFDRSERQDLTAVVKEAEEAARDEVWASYRFVVLADRHEADGLKVIDLGAGHASAGDSLSGRMITALKAEGLLNDSVGAGYLERNWPVAFRETGAWPLSSLRQGFLNGTLTRLVDPDSVLRAKIPEFVTRGELGLGSGPRADATFDRVWIEELLPPDEVAFDGGVALLRKQTAKSLKAGPIAVVTATEGPGEKVGAGPEVPTLPLPPSVPPTTLVTLRVSGSVPSEVWNRIGTRILPKLKASGELTVGVDFSVRLTADAARRLSDEIAQALGELGLLDKVRQELS